MSNPPLPAGIQMPPLGAPRKIDVNKPPVRQVDPPVEKAFRSVGEDELEAANKAIIRNRKALGISTKAFDVPEEAKVSSTTIQTEKPKEPVVIVPKAESENTPAVVEQEPVDYDKLLCIPKIQVDFQIPMSHGSMIMSGLYHKVFCSATLVVLCFDRRCKVSTHFRPPTINEPLNITVNKGANSRTFRVLSAGLGFSDESSSMDYTTLVIDVPTVKPPPSEDEDTVRDERDIFPGNKGNIFDEKESLLSPDDFGD